MLHILVSMEAWGDMTHGSRDPTIRLLDAWRMLNREYGREVEWVEGWWMIKTCLNYQNYFSFWKPMWMIKACLNKWDWFRLLGLVWIIRIGLDYQHWFGLSELVSIIRIALYDQDWYIGSCFYFSRPANAMNKKVGTRPSPSPFISTLTNRGSPWRGNCSSHDELPPHPPELGYRTYQQPC